VLNAHEELSDHIKAIVPAATASTATHAAIVPLFEQLSQQAATALIKRFKMVYYLMRSERPLADFLGLVELSEDLGVPELQVPALLANGTQYASERFAVEASEAIGEWLWQRAKADLAASPALGLLCDESTDAANIKQLIVYVRGVQRGRAFTKFVALIPIDDGKANTITEKLIKFFTDNAIDLLKFVGFASDGASVMTGINHGARDSAFFTHLPMYVDRSC
jgi:hypothetical protein